MRLKVNCCTHMHYAKIHFSHGALTLKNVSCHFLLTEHIFFSPLARFKKKIYEYEKKNMFCALSGSVCLERL
jgi:hypothetical protein